MKPYETFTDRKLRWAGLLENPVISNFQRNCLDFGRVQGLYRALRPYSYSSVLDVGCGLGESSRVDKGVYCGLDNSLRRIGFATRKYQKHSFLIGDALHLPVKSNAFDLVMLIDTSHHLSDEGFLDVLGEMKRVSRRYVVVSDPVVTRGQSKLSSFFYSLDRGACFRTSEQMDGVFARLKDVRLLNIVRFNTFPGLYSRALFVLEKNPSR